MGEELRILVAVPSDALRRIVCANVRHRSLGVTSEVSTEAETRERLGEGGYDLVIVDDALLPVVSWIREQEELQGLPVIIIAHDDASDAFVAAVRAGASDYLTAPYRPQDLASKISQAVESETARMMDIYGTSNLQELRRAADPRSTLHEKIDAVLAASEPEAGEQADTSAAKLPQPIARLAYRMHARTARAAAAADREPQEPDGGVLFRTGLEPVPASESDRPVTSYDFKHPARVNLLQMRTLESLHDNFARLLSVTLSGAMRMVVDVDTAFVDQTTYAEFIMSLSNPCCSYAFTMGYTGGRAVVDIGAPVVCGIVDRVGGGTGSASGVRPRQLTGIEFTQINKIVKPMLEDLEATWSPIQSMRMTDIELETNPEFMQITAAGEIVVLMAFEINTKNASGLLSLCYPYFTLEKLLPLLGQPGHERRDRGARGRSREQNRLTLGDMDVPVVAELGRTRISVGEAERARAGDVIRLSSRASDPARVYVGGGPKFLGWPFAEEGDVKLRLAGKIPPQLQDKYGAAPGD